MIERAEAAGGFVVMRCMNVSTWCGTIPLCYHAWKAPAVHPRPQVCELVFWGNCRTFDRLNKLGEISLSPWTPSDLRMLQQYVIKSMVLSDWFTCPAIWVRCLVSVEEDKNQQKHATVDRRTMIWILFVLIRETLFRSYNCMQEGHHLKHITVVRWDSTWILYISEFKHIWRPRVPTFHQICSLHGWLVTNFTIVA